MEDARILQQPPQPQILAHQQQQQQQQECIAEASGSAVVAWGTLEELFLVSAVSRHGTGDWSSVASELQSRVKLLILPSSSFSPEACKSKFDALSGRYGGSGCCNGGNGREQHPWFDDVRKRRMAHLKRELERHDGCIASLTNRLKRLKAERAQSLPVPSKQHAPEKSGAGLVELTKPADQSAPESCVVQDGDVEVDKRNPPGGVGNEETGISKNKEVSEVSAVENDANRDNVEEVKKFEETAEVKPVAEAMEDGEGAKLLASDESAKVEAADTAKESEAAEMDVDMEDQSHSAQKVEVATVVDTEKRDEDLDEVVVEGSQKGMRQDEDETKPGGDDMVCLKNEAHIGKSETPERETASNEAVASRTEPDEAAQSPVKDGTCRDDGDGMEGDGKSTEVLSEENRQAPAAPSEEKETIEAVSSDVPGVEDTKDATVDKLPIDDQGEPSTIASGDPKASADVTGSKEAVKAFDGNFVGSASDSTAVAAPTTVESGSEMLLDTERTKASEEPLPVLSTHAPEDDDVTKSEANQQPAGDEVVKVVDDTSRLVVDIVTEQPKARRVSQEEKESSDSAAQHSSSTDVKPAADLKEKSDESQGGTRQADSVEKADNVVVSRASTQDVGSPASVNEGSGSALEQSKDSRVERSDVGSQADGPEDSPTSRRTKNETARILKLQPLIDCLRTISNHKLASFFKQKQESQDDPRYAQVVRRHIDLNMIRARLKEGAYSGSLEFFRDILLVFNNCIVFYPRDSPEHNAALVMRKLVMEEMDKLMQAEAGTTKPDKVAPRKRETKKVAAIENSSTKANAKRDTPATAANTTSTTPARQASVPATTTPTTTTTTTTTTGAVENAASDNSRSKSASLSPGGGVPSSKGGGEEDDTREGGEPEVEGGKAKPLKAYGRKNRGGGGASGGAAATAAAAGTAGGGGGGGGSSEHKSGKGVTREKPLDAIVKKIGKAEEAAAAAAAAAAALTVASKDKEKDKEKEKEEKKDRAKDRKDSKASDKQSSSKKKGKGTAAGAQKESDDALPPSSATAAAQAAAATSGAAGTAAPVRGVRNKRSSAKDGQRPAAKRTKR